MNNTCFSNYNQLLRTIVCILTGRQPLCSNNSSAQSIMAGEYVTLTCSLSYYGNVTPSLVWTDFRGAQVNNAINSTAANQLTSFILVPTYYPVVDSFTCTAIEDEKASIIPSCNCSTREVSVGKDIGATTLWDPCVWKRWKH